MQDCMVSCTPTSLGWLASQIHTVWCGSPLAANTVAAEFITDHSCTWPLISSWKTSALSEPYYCLQSVSLTKGLGCWIIMRPRTQGLFAPHLSIPPWHFMGLRSEFSFSSTACHPRLEGAICCCNVFFRLHSLFHLICCQDKVPTNWSQAESGQVYSRP